MNSKDADIPSLVSSVVAEVLQRADISLDDDFFSAGGDSLLAMHVVGRLSRASKLRVRVSLLFEQPVLRDFAAHIERLHDSETHSARGPATPLAAALRPDGQDERLGHAI